MGNAVILAYTTVKGMKLYVPAPLGPIIAVNGLNGPIVCFPLYDLKFSSVISLKYPIVKCVFFPSSVHNYRYRLSGVATTLRRKGEELQPFYMAKPLSEEH